MLLGLLPRLLVRALTPLQKGVQGSPAPRHCGCLILGKPLQVEEVEEHQHEVHHVGG